MLCVPALLHLCGWGVTRAREPIGLNPGGGEKVGFEVLLFPGQSAARGREPASL